MPMSALEHEILTYSYYRDAELHGANLLFLLLRLVDDGKVAANLSRHLADETRHAWLWTERILEIGGEPQKLNDGYQVRLGKRAGRPRNLVDLFCLTLVAEERAVAEYQAALDSGDASEPTRKVLEAVSKDEHWHIQWIQAQAAAYAEAEGDPGRVAEALARYRAMDIEVMAELRNMEAELTAEMQPR